MIKCDGTCGKQYLLEDVILDWYESADTDGEHVKWHRYIKKHYCVPCYDEKFSKDEYPEFKPDNPRELKKV